MTVVMPEQVERRLIDLSKELDSAVKECNAAEMTFHKAKAEYEISMAKARMHAAEVFAERGVKATVQEKEDQAILGTATEMLNLADAEALVKASRQNVNRIRTQVDIARSVAASVRSSLEL